MQNCYVSASACKNYNEVLFYALLTRNIEEMIPIVYTRRSTSLQRFSSIFRKPRGLFLDIPHKHDIRQIIVILGTVTLRSSSS